MCSIIRTPLCHCKPGWDVRCCCDPSYDKGKRWRNCPVRWQTAYFHISNDYNDVILIEEKTIFKTKTYFTKKFRLTKEDWEEIIKYWNEEHETND